MATTSYDPTEMPSLKLSPAEARKVIDGLNRRGGGAPVNRKRRLRLPFEKNNVVIELDDGSGRVVRHRVVSRNLSTFGIAVIHGQFMHVKRNCVVEIPTLDAGAMYRVKGHVERCRLVSGRVHEVAIVFDAAVDLSLFLELDVSTEMRARTEAQTDVADTKKKEVRQQLAVTGNALVVEDFESNRKLYAFWLSKAGFEVHEAATPAAAMHLAKQHPYNIVLVDEHLGTESGVSLIQNLRTSGITCLLISMSAEVNEQLQTAVTQAGADTYLAKPFDRAALESVIHENFELLEMACNDKAATQTELKDPEMKPLIETFVLSISDVVKQLQESLASGAANTIAPLVMDIAEAAKGYGFPSVFRAGTALLEVLNGASVPPLTMNRKLRGFISMLQQCRA